MLFLTILKLRSLHTNLNLLVIGVTAADVLSAVSSQPMDIAYLVTFPANPLNFNGKLVWNSLYYTYVTILAYALCAINLDRLIAILYLLRYYSVMTRKIIYRMVLSCWLYGVITFEFLTYLQYMQLSRHDGSTKLNTVVLIPNKWILLTVIMNLLSPSLISFMALIYVTQVASQHKRQRKGLSSKFGASALESQLPSIPTLQTLARCTDGARLPTILLQTAGDRLKIFIVRSCRVRFQPLLLILGLSLTFFYVLCHTMQWKYIKGIHLDQTASLSGFKS